MKRRAFLASLAVVPAAVLLPKPTPRVPIFHPDAFVFCSESVSVGEYQRMFNRLNSALIESAPLTTPRPWVMTCS